MPEDTLVDRLLASAEKFAQSALRARLDFDSMVYLLHAGTALELLAKAYLASVNGSLIAANDVDSLLHCSGHARRAKTSAMKTITATEAMKRAIHLDAEFKNHEDSWRLLADIRNGVVHAGSVEKGAEESVFVPFLRVCDLLIERTPGADRDRMWGDLISTVDARLSESAKAIELLVADSLDAARLVYEQRYKSMEDDARKGALAAIDGSYDVTKYEEALTDCPACGRQAFTAGGYDLDWEAEWDVEGSRGEAYIIGGNPIVTYRPGYLRCRVCDLELDGEEELRAAGVPESWEIDDVDPADFYDD